MIFFLFILRYSFFKVITLNVFLENSCAISFIKKNIKGNIKFILHEKHYKK